MTKGNMIRYYRYFSAAGSYIIGFTYDHIIYMTTMAEIKPRYLTVEQASRNYGDALRLRIRKEHKPALLKNAIALGPETQLIDTVGHINDKGQLKYWNKGDMFEKLVAEHFGLVWVKDTTGFWVKGDINVNGIEIQIKFADASLTNTNQLHRLQKGLR